MRLNGRIVCDYCNEPIGSYEPLVVVDGDTTTETSLLASPELREREGPLLHAECWQRAAA